MTTKNISAAITAAEAASMAAYRDRNPRIRGIFASPAAITKIRVEMVKAS